MKPSLLLLAVLFLASSCSLQFEKRRYRSGYHTDFSWNHHSIKSKIHTDKSTPAYAEIKDERQPVSVISHSSGKILPGNSPDISSELSASIEKGQTRGTGVTLTSNAVKRDLLQLRETTVISESNSVKRKLHRDGWFLASCGVLFALAAGFFHPLIPKTKLMGWWALLHRHKVRPLFFALNSLLALSGFYLGVNLHRLGIDTTDVSTYSLSALAGALILGYPHRRVKAGIFKPTYTRQKWYALILALTGMMLFANFGNRYASEKYLDKTISAISVIPGQPVYSTLQHLAADQNDDSADTAGRVIAVVFVIIVCVALCILIAALACGLACNGQVALSILLLAVGIPAVVLLTVHAVKKILEPFRKRRKMAAEGK
jgi:hypothetical protein